MAEVVTAVHTEVLRHPVRSGWAVYALVATELGNVLYVSRDAWTLYESAVRWQRDVLDGELEWIIGFSNEMLAKGFVPNLFESIAELDLLEQLPAPWRPDQFDAL